MNQIIFTETHRATRTNIAASFEFWSKEKFLINVKEKKQYSSLYRYGYVDSGWVKLTKDMSLEEFETVFTPAEIESFSAKQITAFFRKEISEKYGEHKIKAAIKTLTKKELQRGIIYEDINGIKYLYLGKVRLLTEQNPGYGKNEVKEDKTGEGFKYWYSEKEFEDKDCPNVDVLKGIKKLVKAVGTIDLKENYSYMHPKNGYHYYNTTYTLTLI